MATQETRQPILQAKGLYKRYGHVTAIDGADFELYPGEILAVIGDNGAGKSSLIKALSGAVIPDAGEILLDGQPAKFRSPLDARAAGIETVYQDLAVSPSLDIATNLFLGRERRRAGFRGSVLRMLDLKGMREAAKLEMSALGLLTIQDMGQAVETLSGGQRQGVAVARAAAFGQRVVIMDEPTAALAIKEVGKVLDLIKSLKDHGVAVIVISHRMDDIFYCCDRVMALYQGTNFADAPLTETSRNEVIGWIMGTKGHKDSLAHDRVH